MKYEWVKQIQEQDRVDFVALINTVSLKETTLGYHELISETDGQSLVAAINRDLANGSAQVLLVRNDADKIVGTVTLSPQPLPARRHIVEMKRCVIHPDHRGEFLLWGFRLALEKSLEIGCDMVILDVRSDGPAADLWRKIGFREYGRLEDFARVRGKKIVGYYMVGYVDELRAALPMLEKKRAEKVQQMQMDAARVS